MLFSVGGDIMSAPSWTLFLLLLTLHLQSHHTRNLLLNVDTDDKDSRVSSNSNKALGAPRDNATGLTVTFTHIRDSDTNHIPEQKTIEILNDCS